MCGTRRRSLPIRDDRAHRCRAFPARSHSAVERSCTCPGSRTGHPLAVRHRYGCVLRGRLGAARSCRPGQCPGIQGRHKCGGSKDLGVGSAGIDVRSADHGNTCRAPLPNQVAMAPLRGLGNCRLVCFANGGDRFLDSNPGAAAHRLTLPDR